MKNRRAALLPLLLLAGCVGLSTFAHAEGIELGTREATNLGISLVQPQPTDRRATLSAMAEVVVPPTSDLAIGALHGGVVTRLYMGTGDRVIEGQPLAALTSPAFLTLQSDYLDALGMQALAETARIRDEQLHREGIVSQRRLNETSTRAAEARLHLAEQRQLLILSGLTADEISQLEQTRQLFETLTVRSPGSGDVLKRWIGPGDQVSPGAPMFRVADLRSLWLEIQLPVEALPIVPPGSLVTRNVPGTEQELARITVATRVVDPVSQKAVVRAETTGADQHLLPGQRIEVMIHVAGSGSGTTTAWEVPGRAVTRHGSQSYLFARSATGFEAVPVTVLGGNGEIAYVEAAITGQTRIALTGVAALKALWLSAAEDSE